MKFSEWNVMKLERDIIADEKEYKDAGFFTKLLYKLDNPRRVAYRFTFYVPSYLFLRSVSFCETVAELEGVKFDVENLADVLYTDFLEYYKRHNDLHTVYRQLTARELSPAAIKPYNTEEAYAGVIAEEVRGYEPVDAVLWHKDALLGEYLLRDMLEVYPEHEFTLEAVLEVVFCSFVDEFRKGLIKNPVAKIAQYLF